MKKDTDPMITAYIPVFQEKVDKMKKRLRSELEKTKSDREKNTIRSLIKTIKKLQKTIRAAKKDETRCPHCGEIL